MGGRSTLNFDRPDCGDILQLYTYVKAYKIVL